MKPKTISLQVEGDDILLVKKKAPKAIMKPRTASFQEGEDYVAISGKAIVSSYGNISSYFICYTKGKRPGPWCFNGTSFSWFYVAPDASTIRRDHTNVQNSPEQVVF